MKKTRMLGQEELKILSEIKNGELLAQMPLEALNMAISVMEPALKRSEIESDKTWVYLMDQYDIIKALANKTPITDIPGLDESKISKEEYIDIVINMVMNIACAEILTRVSKNELQKIKERRDELVKQNIANN